MLKGLFAKLLGRATTAFERGRVADPGDQDLLEEWAWLVPGGQQVIFVSCFGDIVLEKASGEIDWLDVNFAQLMRMAGDREEFQQRLAAGAYDAEFFYADLAGDLRSMPLAAGPGDCCYGFAVPLALGGARQVSNLGVEPRILFNSRMADLGQQLSSVPPGGKVVMKVDWLEFFERFYGPLRALSPNASPEEIGRELVEGLDPMVLEVLAKEPPEVRRALFERYGIDVEKH